MSERKAGDQHPEDAPGRAMAREIIATFGGEDGRWDIEKQTPSGDFLSLTFEDTDEQPIFLYWRPHNKPSVGFGLAPSPPVPAQASCNWVGGNDYAACTVCGSEYDYRKTERPPCPRAFPNPPVPASEPGRATLDPLFSTEWERQDYERQKRGEPPVRYPGYDLEIHGRKFTSHKDPASEPGRATVPGMKTTAEERARWRDEAEMLLQETMEGPYSVVCVLLRDLDRAIAENARLTAALAEAEGRIAEYQSIVEASPAVQKAMGHFHSKLAERRLAERDAVTDDLDRALAENARLTEHNRILGESVDAIAAQAETAEGKVARLTAELAQATRGLGEAVLEGHAYEAAAREEGREALLRDIQAMREQYAPLEAGEAVMLDTLQDRIERRAKGEPLVHARSKP